MEKKLLLIIGSPNVSNSTSEVLGDYILEQLQQKSVVTYKIKVNKIFKEEGGMEKLITAVNNADVIIFSSPLYVDSLPANVIRTMEIISENRKMIEVVNKQTMYAICNCGFVEAKQNHTALAIYRCFAIEAGFAWGGGLALGGGGAIAGRPLDKLGGMVRNLIKALNLVSEAIFEGKSVPEEAVELIEKPMSPTWLYLLFGNLGWIRQARKNGVHSKINDSPYKI